MSSFKLRPRDLIYVTIIGIIVFVATTLLSNYFLKSGPEIIHFGYPFCFYYEYGGYMAQQHGSELKYLIIDVLIAWSFALVLFYVAKLAGRVMTKQPK